MSKCRCVHVEALEQIITVASYYPALDGEIELAAMASKMEQIAKKALGIKSDASKRKTGGA